MKFGSIDKMRITYSEPKYYLGRSGKDLITSMGLKTNVRSEKCKMSRYDIANVIIKYLSNIIKEFENYLIRVMCGIVPNMNPPTVTFT